MKPWWDNPQYHNATTDRKIAAWSTHCKDIERQLQATRNALCEAIYWLNDFGAYKGLIARWKREAGLTDNAPEQAHAGSASPGSAGSVEDRT